MILQKNWLNRFLSSFLYTVILVSEERVPPNDKGVDCDP